MVSTVWPAVTLAPLGASLLITVPATGARTLTVNRLGPATWAAPPAAAPATTGAAVSDASTSPGATTSPTSTW